VEGKGPAPGDIAKIVNSKIDFKEAVQRLDNRLPEEVASLIRMSGSTEEGMGTVGSSESLE